MDPSLSMARASMIRLEPIVKAQQEAEMQEMLGTFFVTPQNVYIFQEN